jgi:hypothetical protein
MPATPVARRADPIIHGMPHAAAPQADAWRAALRGSRSADVELRAVRQPRLGFGHRRSPGGLVRPSVRRARICVHSKPVIYSRHDPVGQVPALLLPDGQVMTESAAMTLHLADLSGRDDLVPGPAAAERAAFLRWLVFLVANIYPTFIYADDPSRFVKDEAARAGFLAACDAHAQRLWLAV